MKIRPALPEEAEAICQLLKCSITQLCEADHKNDPAILDRWAGSKTPEVIAAWIADKTSTMLVATEASTILAVGSITLEGEIALNYVSPEARFRGISRALVRALEARGAEQSNVTCFLSSTGAARQFYLSLGYTEKEAEVGMFGAVIYPMSKSILT